MMFKLRDDHRSAFRQASREGFEGRAMARLRHDWPGPTQEYQDDEFTEQFREWEHAAHDHGFRTELEILHFAEANLLLGSGFEKAPEHEWARNVLESNQLNSSEKARLLSWTAGHIHRDRQSAIQIETPNGPTMIKMVELES